MKQDRVIILSGYTKRCNFVVAMRLCDFYMHLAIKIWFLIEQPGVSTCTTLPLTVCNSTGISCIVFLVN